MTTVSFLGEVFCVVVWQQPHCLPPLPRSQQLKRQSVSSPPRCLEIDIMSAYECPLEALLTGPLWRKISSSIMKPWGPLLRGPTQNYMSAPGLIYTDGAAPLPCFIPRHSLHSHRLPALPLRFPPHTSPPPSLCELVSPARDCLL